MTNQEFELRLAVITAQAEQEKDAQTLAFFDRLLEETNRIQKENTELLQQINTLQIALDNALS